MDSAFLEALANFLSTFIKTVVQLIPLRTCHIIVVQLKEEYAPFEKVLLKQILICEVFGTDCNKDEVNQATFSLGFCCI